MRQPDPVPLLDLKTPADPAVDGATGLTPRAAIAASAASRPNSIIRRMRRAVRWFVLDQELAQRDADRLSEAARRARDDEAWWSTR